MLYTAAVSLSRNQKSHVLLAIDVVLIAFAHVAATALYLGSSGFDGRFAGFAVGLAVVMFVGTTLTVVLGLHRIKLNAYQVQGVVETAFIALIMTGSGVIASLLAPPPAMPPQIYVVTGMLFLILSVMTRLLLRQLLLFLYRKGNPRAPILIYGAGQTGQQLATALGLDDAVEPVAFIDDDRRLQNLTITGLKVHSPAEIDELVARYAVRRIVLAMPSAKPTVRTAITKRLMQTGCEVHALPSFADLVTSAAKGVSDTKPVNINDLLGRAHLEKELPGANETYHGRNIMVTGAGGTIGSELCRQLLACKPQSLVLVDHSELALFEIDRELRSLAPDIPIVPLLGNVCERSLVVGAMATNKVEIVLHAAAYKHVPLVESNPFEGTRNNVFGTRMVAHAAQMVGVERFILVSTDKAVRPTSIMGASKRFAELVVQDLATRSTSTRFSMVRFGNVLGSSGSVIPLFQEQIARGGPVTLTHSDVTRYFMTIQEAVRLVLLAGSFARGGDVFVLDMGKPVPIRDLARKMIENAGHTVRDEANPKGDIEIRITGLRPGEKLHEELLIGSDMLTTPHPKILRAQEFHISEIEIANALQGLRQSIEGRNIELLNATLAQWIEPENETDVADLTVNE